MNLGRGSAVILTALILTFLACKKDNKTAAPPVTGGGGTVVITKPTEPALASTQGFFLDGWQPKTFALPPAYVTSAKPADAGITAMVDVSQVITKVSKLMYGNNTNPYMTQYVTEPVLMDYLTKLSPNILRFPGGSLSDVYFWNQSSTAPADAPAMLLDNAGTASNAGYWYGNNTSSYTFTLDNYYKVLQQTNSTGIITVNYGYARYGTSVHPDQVAAHLAADWVRYDKGRTKFWEIGNENWGNFERGYRINTANNKDGQPQLLTGDLYGKHFKVFADSMRKAAAEVGNTGIKIAAVITEADERNNPTVIVSGWNKAMLAQVGDSPDFYIVHNYYTPYQQNSSPEVILATPQTVSASTMAWVKSSVQAAGVTQKPVALDEWNIFAQGSQQMVSNVAGVHAAMVLGELIKDQFGMAARWDLANGWEGGNDHGLFNIGDEPGADKWNPRPAFYYMYFFQKYIGDRMVSSAVTGSSDIVSYGSSFTSGEAGTILVNKSTADHVVTINFKNFLPGAKYFFYTLNGGTDNASFSRKVVINGTGPAGVSGGPLTYTGIAARSNDITGGITVNVPALGAVYLVAQSK